MLSAVLSDSLAGPYRTLLQGTHQGILHVDFLPPDSVPSDGQDVLVLPLRKEGGASFGNVVMTLAPGTDARLCEQSVRPVLDCLVGSLAAASDNRYNDLKLMDLANKLDLDFQDDTRLDKAVAAVAHRLGVELAWFAAPRCHLAVAKRGKIKEVDPGEVPHRKAAQAAPAGWRVQAVAGAALRRPGTPQRLAGAGESPECATFWWLAHSGSDDDGAGARAPSGK
jgi:hypothetical protein